MVGVGETVMSKDLPKNKKLVLHMDWESDEGLIEDETVLDGSLPGGGVTIYTLGIIEGDDLDFERVLQEFRFRGSGGLSPKDAPPKARDAFDKWYEKLTRVSEESLDKAKKIRDQVVEALNNLSGEGPEPRGNNRKSHRVEALSWLKNSKVTSAFASNRFGTTSEVVEVVKGLYTLGAVRVEIEAEDDDSYSETMIVHGSEESEERLFCYIGSLRADEVQYERGSFFWRLWWD